MNPPLVEHRAPAAPNDLGLLIAAAPIVVCAIILAVRGLGQTRAIAIAIARLVIQITALGYVLSWVFDHSSPLTALAAAAVMLGFSASTAAARGSRHGGAAGLRLESLFALALAVTITMSVAIRLALRVEPWYSTRTLVPILGMVLGNSVHGVALAAERFTAELYGDRDRVELRLALGATAREAALPALRAAVSAGLTPTINSMMIAGVVSVPGMATGQILAGGDLAGALRYQILVYFLIIASVAIAVLVILRIRLGRCFTRAHQLRPDFGRRAGSA